MKPAQFLRAAAVISLLAALGHTYLFLTYSPSHGPAEIAVVAAMKSASFRFGWPAPHSYWELYFGYGLFVAVSCFVEAGILWFLTALADSHPARIMPIAAILFLGEFGYAALMYKFFFVIPIVAHSALAVCLAAAFFTSSSQKQAAT